MNKFTTRAYNSFTVHNNKNSIIKKSNDKKLLDEIEYYRNIPKSLELYFPRFIDGVKKDDDFNYLELEYYAYEDLGLKMIYDEFNLDFWTEFFDQVHKYFESYKNHSISIDTQKDSEKMFVDKTYNEYINLIQNFDFFKDLVKNEELIFNGKKLKSFDFIWDTIKSKLLKDCISSKFYYFHGDFCFNNIIYGINKKTQDVIFKFIDPRGKFGDTNFYGDNFYDLSKLSHSCSGGYEYFINDEFVLNQISENEFNLEFSKISLL